MKYWYLYIPASVCFVLPFLYAVFSKRSGKNADGSAMDNDRENPDSSDVRIIVRRKTR